MPALPDVAGGIRITLRQSQGANTNIVDRIYGHYVGQDPTATNLTQQATNITSYWLNHIAPQVCLTFFLQQVTVTALHSTGGPEGTVSTVHGGTHPGEVLPRGDCARLNFLVGRRYRGGHGGIYQSGIPETVVDDDSSITQPYAGQLQTAWDGFLNNIFGSPWTGATQYQHVVISYYHGFTAHQTPSGRYRNIPTLRPTPLVDPVIGTKLNDQIASQRRRDLIA